MIKFYSFCLLNTSVSFEMYILCILKLCQYNTFFPVYGTFCPFRGTICEWCFLDWWGWDTISQLKLSVGIRQLIPTFLVVYQDGLDSCGQMWLRGLVSPKWWLRTQWDLQTYFISSSTTRNAIISIQTDNTGLCFSICPSSVHRVGGRGTTRVQIQVPFCTLWGETDNGEGVYSD